MRLDTTYVITLNCGEREVPRLAMETLLYGARDWLRWSGDTYFIRTNLSADEWLKRIRGVLAPGDDVFIAAIDMNNRVGWMKDLPLKWLTRDEVGIPSGV
jgi:hypothetical protein